MSAPQEQLNQRLSDQISVSDAFLRLLLRERETIASNKIQELPAITEEKIELIQQLSQTEIDILAIIKATLGEAATENPREALNTLDPNQQFKLIELLDEARELAKKCKHENEINTQIVNASQDQVEQILNTLLGREKASTYGSTGKTVSGNSGGTLGKA